MRYRIVHFFIFAALWLTSHAAFGDWAAASSPLAVRPSPDGNDVIAQNPPGFTWSRHASMPLQYELELIAPNGQHSLIPTSRNWYLPDHLMETGNWAWRVRPRGNVAWSDMRRFTLGPDARPFVVPGLPVLKARVLQHARPRSLPALADGSGALGGFAAIQRPEPFARLKEQVRKQLQLPSVSDSDYPLDMSGRLDANKMAQIRKVYSRVTEICQQAESAAFLFILTRDDRYRNEAMRRSAQLAALNPTGPTGYAQDDQTARRVAMSLALVSDQLNEHLTPGVQKAWWKIVGQRTQQIYADLGGDQLGGGNLEQHPKNSHGSVALGYLAALATLSLGELPEAERWFNFAVRYNFQYVWPYAGSEGGYANGTAYAQYAVHDALRVWPILLNATGVNLFSKPWSEGLVNFFAWFVPPGAPTHMFGDDAESKPSPWLLKAFASRVRTPVAKWYARNLIGEVDALIELQAPNPLPVDEVSVWQPPASAAWIRSIGWVAMHSDIADRGRTSVYFKSSGFGSDNHSHGDQNSFVINSGGRPLLTDSGIYDWYGSPHWLEWYRTTAAHNAVTFDGGRGQLTNGTREATAAAIGHILAAQLELPLYRVEGDATSAYSGNLSMARRTLWYAPAKGWVIVRDKLASTLARHFELNLHAPGPFIKIDSGYRVSADGISACIDVLTPQLLAQGITSFGYPVVPEVAKPTASYSLRMVTTQLTQSAELWFAIRIGCEGTLLAHSISESHHAQVSDGTTILQLD
jgi:hypothetical protein